MEKKKNKAEFNVELVKFLEEGEEYKNCVFKW